MEYEKRILEFAKKMLQEAEVFTPDFNVTFAILSNINQEYQAVTSRYNSDDPTMSEQMCALVLHGDFIVTKCRAALLSTVHNEIEPKKSSFPQTVHPIVEEIDSYFASMKKELEMLDSSVKQIYAKVRNNESVQNIVAFFLFHALAQWFRGTCIFIRFQACYVARHPKALISF